MSGSADTLKIGKVHSDVLFEFCRQNENKAFRLAV